MEACGQTMIPKPCRENGVGQVRRECSSRVRWAAKPAAARQSPRPEISSATARTSPNTRWAFPRRAEFPRRKTQVLTRVPPPPSSRRSPARSFGGKHESVSLEQRGCGRQLDVIEKLARGFRGFFKGARPHPPLKRT